MSADNGVYILHTKDTEIEDENGWWSTHHYSPINVYRVAHTSGIDNFFHIEETQLYMLGVYMHEVWGESKVHLELEDALKEASEIEKKLTICEYGISIISDGRYSFT